MPDGNTKTQVTPGGTYTFSWRYRHQHDDRHQRSGHGELRHTTTSNAAKARRYRACKPSYLYDGQNLIRETGAATADYLFGPGIDEPLAMSRGGSIYYYDVDGLGSATLVNNSTGTVQNSYVMDAWGIVRIANRRRRQSVYIYSAGIRRSGADVLPGAILQPGNRQINQRGSEAFSSWS